MYMYELYINMPLPAGFGLLQFGQNNETLEYQTEEGKKTSLLAWLAGLRSKQEEIKCTCSGSFSRSTVYAIVGTCRSCATWLRTQRERKCNIASIIIRRSSKL